MTDRPNDPAAEQTTAHVLAEHTPDRVPGTAVPDNNDGWAVGHPVRVHVDGGAAVDPEPPTPPRPRQAVEAVSARDPAPLDPTSLDPPPLDPPPLDPPPLDPAPLDPPPVDPPPPDDPLSLPDSAPHPGPAARALPPRPDARPRIVEDPAILGLSRVSRSRLGSRLFTWFFVFVYALILVQLIVTLLQT